MRRPGGGVEWNEATTQLVLELLAQRTPPSCVVPNILSVANILLPNYAAIEKLPGMNFVRRSRGTLAYLTKLIAAKDLAEAPVYIESHSDGTERRQTHLGNNIIRIAADGGYKNVTLDACILSEDETSEMVVDGILKSFQSARLMLEEWLEVTKELYPDRPDLWALIPKAEALTIAKLAKSGWIMTDTCNAARKFRRLFIEAIREVAKEEGLDEKEIAVWEAGELNILYETTYHLINVIT